MKKAALYILLFSYSFALLKPVGPYISDTIAHIFYYTKHMATVHYENGKFHVHKEIVENEKKNDPVKEKPSSKKDNTDNNTSLIEKVNEYQPLFLDNDHSISPTHFLHSANTGLDYPPPKS